MKTTPQLTLSQVNEGYFLAAHARRLSSSTIRDYNNTYTKLCKFLSEDITILSDPAVHSITGRQPQQLALAPQNQPVSLS